MLAFGLGGAQFGVQLDLGIVELRLELRDTCRGRRRPAGLRGPRRLRAQLRVESGLDLALSVLRGLGARLGRSELGGHLGGRGGRW